MSSTRDWSKRSEICWDRQCFDELSSLMRGFEEAFHNRFLFEGVVRIFLFWQKVEAQIRITGASKECFHLNHRVLSGNLQSLQVF